MQKWPPLLFLTESRVTVTNTAAGAVKNGGGGGGGSTDCRSNLLAYQARNQPCNADARRLRLGTRAKVAAKNESSGASGVVVSQSGRKF